MDVETGSQAITAISVGRLRETELKEADRIFRLAFGTFLGLPDPLAFMAGAELVRHRWRANPDAFHAARAGSELIGSNVANCWGSVGFFGPLTVRPDWWGRGIAKKLLEASLPAFDRCRHVGLFTFPHSPMHLALYQKFGFRPRALTAVTAKTVAAAAMPASASQLGGSEPQVRRQALQATTEITDELYPGLDLRSEMRSILDAHSGDVIVVHGGSRLVGFAVYHCGAGSEAEPGSCYIKFAAARRPAHFETLLGACEAVAARCGAARLVAGVNTGRTAAYEMLLARGYRTEVLGVTMHRPNEPGYSTPDALVIDDWR